MLVFLLLLLCSCGGTSDGDQSLEEARQAFASGQYLQSEKLYERYLQINPKGTSRWESWNRILDITLHVRDEPRKAVALMEAIYLEYGDDEAKAWSLLSRLAGLYEGMRQWDKAVDAWQRALGLPNLPLGESAEVRLRLAGIYRHMRDYDLAQDTLTLCVEEAADPEVRATCLYDLAQIQADLHITAKAEGLLLEIMAEPDVSRERKALAGFALADLYEAAQDLDRAEEMLRSIMDDYPNPKAVEVRLRDLRREQ
jgi:tetratricopeptide (TPR) repeat protein